MKYSMIPWKLRWYFCWTGTAFWHPKQLRLSSQHHLPTIIGQNNFEWGAFVQIYFQWCAVPFCGIKLWSAISSIFFEDTLSLKACLLVFSSLFNIFPVFPLLFIQFKSLAAIKFPRSFFIICHLFRPLCCGTSMTAYLFAPPLILSHIYAPPIPWDKHAYIFFAPPLIASHTTGFLLSIYPYFIQAEEISWHSSSRLNGVQRIISTTAFPITALFSFTLHL